jgi:hypothetical protein
MKDICLWTYRALTRETATCICSLPVPLTVNKLICHSQQYLENMSIIRLKPKCLMEFNDMKSGPNFIAMGLTVEAIQKEQI